MWLRFKEWFKDQSTGRQYAVVLGIGFVLLVLVGAASGGDRKGTGEQLVGDGRFRLGVLGIEAGGVRRFRAVVG